MMAKANEATSNVISLKDQLLDEISDAVKKLQKEQFSTDSPEILPLNNDHPDLQKLCEKLDHVLLHGLRGFERGYWPYVAEYTRKEEVHLIKHLSSVTTDLGRGRAWLLQSLNENALENYLRLFSSNATLMAKRYDPNAIMRDEERLPVLLTLASGLDFLTFELTINCEYFDYGAFCPAKAGLLNLGPLPLNKLLALHLPKKSQSFEGNEANSPTDSVSLPSTSPVSFMTSKIKNFILKQSQQSETDGTAATYSRSAPTTVSALQTFTEDRKTPLTPTDGKQKWSWTNMASKVAQKAKSAKAMALSKASAAKTLVMEKMKRDKGTGTGEEWAAVVSVESGAPVRMRAASQGEASGGGGPEKAEENLTSVGRFERIENIPEAREKKEKENKGMERGEGIKVQHLEVVSRKKGGKKKKKKKSPEISSESNDGDSVSLFAVGGDLPQSDSSTVTSVSISVETQNGNVDAGASDDQTAAESSLAIVEEVQDILTDPDEQNRSPSISQADDTASNQTRNDDVEDEKAVSTESVVNDQKIETEPEEAKDLVDDGDVVQETVIGNEDEIDGARADTESPSFDEIASNGSVDEVETVEKNKYAIFDASGFPIVPFLTELDFKSADVSFDQNTKLLLMLEILGNEDEEMIRFVNGLLCYGKSDYRSASFLITENSFYILGKDGSGGKYEKLKQWPFTKLDHLEVSMNWQTMSLVDHRKSHLTVITANEAVTRSLCESIQLIAAENVGVSLPIFKSDDLRDLLIRKACLASEKNKVAPIDHYGLVFWEPLGDAPGMEAAYGHIRVVKEGKLSVRSSILGVSYWREDYFVLDVKNGIIMQYGSQNDRDCRASFTLRGGNCGGCRRRQDSEKPNAFEIISVDKSVDSLVLAADSAEDTQEWLIKILEAVAGAGAASDHRARDYVPCSMVLLTDKIHLFHEEHKDHPVELLTSCKLEDISNVYYDSECLAYASVNFESPEQGSSGSWLFFFASQHELAKFQTSLATSWKRLFQIQLPFLEMVDGLNRSRARDTVALLHSTVHRNDSITRGRDKTP